MVKVKDLGPLDWRIGIVDKAGRPTPEFQRRWDAQRNNNSLIGSITLGSGAPSGTPEDGAEYIDISTTPYTLYVGNGGTWHKVGVVHFTDLADVPHDYAGHTTDLIQVNPGETGLQFVAIDTLLKTGFSFYSGGLLLDNEELGAGVWTTDILFQSGQLYDISSIFPATADAVFTIKQLITGIWMDIGTITFSAGTKMGVLAWTAPVTIPAGVPISLWAPSVADVTLSSVTGMINGTHP